MEHRGPSEVMTDPEAEDDALFSALMRKFAIVEGERYMAEHKQLQEAPSTAISSGKKRSDRR